jgi:uncharacterized protein YkwD
VFCAFSASAQFNGAAANFAAKENDEFSRKRIIKITNAKSSTTFDLEKSAFALLNQKRAENNLKPLEWSEEVAKIARNHSQNMAKYKFFNHRGVDGLMVDERADAFGIGKWRAIGENIAFNQGYQNPVEFAVQRWMMSPTHRDNILNNRWQESAVGVAVGDNGAFYFTQVFLLRK